MKRYIVLFALAVSSLMILQGCNKENNGFGPMGDMVFNIQLPQMADESGAKVHFNNYTFGNLLFDEGDVIYVNNIPFTIAWNESRGCWTAVGNSADMTNETNDTLLGESFNVLYYKSPATKESYRSGKYTVRTAVSAYNEALNSGGDQISLTFYNTGIVLAGHTSDSIITMRPTFAIVRCSTVRTFDRVAMGFSSSVVASKLTLTPTSGFPTINSASRLSAIEQIEDEYGSVIYGDLILAKESDDIMDDAGSYKYYFLVPLAGDATASTSDDYTLYLQTKLGSTFYSAHSTSNYDLQRGTIYTISL
jgi:hypothetical protein